MVRKTKEEALETRQRIVETAERIFHEKGVSHTSLHDIAAAAGVTRGAIYWHFKNKGDLIDAMCREVELPMDEAFRPLTESVTDDPIERLRACYATALRSMQQPKMRRVVEILLFKCEYVDETAEIRQRHIQSREQSLQRIHETINQAVAAGQLPATIDTRYAAIGVEAALTGLFMDWLLVTDGFDLLKIGTFQLDTILRGLGWSGPSPTSAAT